MGVKILHLADLHLGYVPRFLDPAKGVQRDGELRDAFRRAVDYALESRNRVSAVIIAGDLFETYRPDSGVRGFAAAQLERLSSASLPVLIIPGTHDSVGYPDSIYRTETFPASVHVLAEPQRRPPLELTLDGERFVFHWLTYEPGEKRSVAEYLRTLKQGLSVEQGLSSGHRVFIAHASLKGSPAWDMRRKDLPVALEDLLASGMDYVALGHYHNFWESGQGRSQGTSGGIDAGGPGRGREGSGVSGGGGSGSVGAGSVEGREAVRSAAKVVYPGTLEGKHFGENGPRYLVVAEFEPGGVTVHKTQFNKRILEEREFSLDSEAVSSEKELVKRIGILAKEDMLLRVTLTGSPEFPLRTEFLEEALSEKFFHIEIEDRTSVLSTISVEATSKEKTVRGMFVRKLREAALSAPEEERPLYELAIKEGLSAFGEGE